MTKSTHLQASFLWEASHICQVSNSVITGLNALHQLFTPLYPPLRYKLCEDYKCLDYDFFPAELNYWLDRIELMNELSVNVTVHYHLEE